MLIKSSEELHSDLTTSLQFQEVRTHLEYVENTPASIKNTLESSSFQVIFIADDETSDTKSLLAQALHQNSTDTLLVFISQYRNSQAISVHSSGLERCIISCDDLASHSPLLQTTLAYALLKKHFRQCKNLLHVSEQRSQWLVNTTHEAVAFIHNNRHIQGNPAYLDLFNATSQTELKNTPLLNLVMREELPTFNTFIKKYSQCTGNNHALHLSMKKISGESFRASIRVIPSVVNNIRCLQIWVKRLKNTPTRNTQKESIEQLVTPWNEPSNMTSQKALSNKDKASRKMHNSLIKKSLRDWLKSSAPKLALTELNAMNKRLSKLYLVNLALPKDELYSINELIISSGSMDVKVFWERILITLAVRKSISVKKPEERGRYIISLSEETVFDRRFLPWLKQLFDARAYNTQQTLSIIPGMSLEHLKKHPHDGVRLINSIRTIGLPIVIEDFIPNEQNLTLLQKIKPDFLWISKNWLEIAVLNPDTLNSFIAINQYLEELGINVIISAFDQYDIMAKIHVHYVFHDDNAHISRQ